MMHCRWFLFFLSHGSMAWSSLITSRADKKFEWTALGDSYASGVGSTDLVDGRRCLRYNQAYPVLLNRDSSLAKEDHIFNNAACSGAHYDDIENYQFYDTDKTSEPSWQYSPRPKFGNPQMATLSVGGDDIDFPGIVFNCILDSHFIGAPPQRTCEDQRKHSWSLINSPDLVNNIDHLIKKTVTKGRAGTIGDRFKLYVTGYGEFFNAVDPKCDDVTFARTANPKPDGKEHTKLTRGIRADFNHMSLALNAAIRDAVNRNSDHGVKFIDIQGNGALDGHRFCEPGVDEPDQNNADLWFWHYPYNQPKNADTEILQEASDKVASGLSTQQLGSKYPETKDYTNALFDALDLEHRNDVETQGLWSFIGYRARVFHPQVSFHTHIKDLVLAQYKSDTKNPDIQAPFSPGTCCFHMYQWRYPWSRENGFDKCQIQLLDNNKHKISALVKEDCSDKHPLSVNSKLENPIVITPEAQGDYVQFTVGGFSFRNTDKNHCSSGKWNLDDDPVDKQMDCCFPCNYHGGKCSDGSC